jgi:hypothetical protein
LAEEDEGDEAVSEGCSPRSMSGGGEEDGGGSFMSRNRRSEGRNSKLGWGGVVVAGVDAYLI